MIIPRLVSCTCIIISLSSAVQPGSMMASASSSHLHPDGGKPVVVESRSSRRYHTEVHTGAHNHVTDRSVNASSHGEHTITTERNVVDGIGQERREECTGSDCHVETTPITLQSGATPGHGAGPELIHPSY